MRKYDIDNPYEKLKDFTRGKSVITRDMYLEFIDTIDGLPEEEKQRMRELTP